MAYSRYVAPSSVESYRGIDSEFENIKDNTNIFSEVDILDGTPLLDIKPYVARFESRKKVKNGGIDKHFNKGRVLKRIKVR